MTSDSPLERKLREGKFVITAEMSPPDAASEAAVMAKVGCLKGLVDAVNVTDSASARAHMSALPCAAIMARNGIEPILQFTVRDRNRLAIQGDLIGAPPLGITTILCLHGDSIEKGDQPEAKPVVDIDSRTLMTTARQLRETGTLPSGRKIEPPPRHFIGGADSPKDPEPGFKPTTLEGKIAAGADFFQTQFVYDLAMLERYMAVLWEHGIPQRAFFIIGTGPLTSAKSARWMNETLFGVHVPEAVIQRLEGATDQAAEGRRICAELIAGARRIRGVSGVHLMSPRGEQAIAAMLAEMAAATA